MFTFHVCTNGDVRELAGYASFPRVPHHDVEQRSFERTFLSPDEVPEDSVVFVGIAGGAADRIAGRLSQSHPAVSWIPGPPLV